MIIDSKRTWYFVLITLGVVLLVFSAEFLGFFEGIDSHIYDTSFRIRGPRAVSDRVVIVAIDEKTLDTFGRWPLKREYYARLLNTLGPAAMVGFDLIMTEPTEDDAVLAAAMQRHGRVVVPVYIGKNLKKMEPAPLFAPYRKGHIHIELGIDNVARELSHTLYYQGVQLPSMASVIYEATTGSKVHRHEPPARTDILTVPARLFQLDLQKINYYGPPGTFKQVSLADILAGRFSSAFFNDKIALVGLTAPGIVDELSTPFSQNRDRMPGVEVHANALSNLLLDGSIREATGWVRWLAALVMAFLLGVSFHNLSEKNAALLWLLTLFIIMGTVFTLFTTLNLWIKPALFCVTVTVAYIITYLYRLDSAARKLDNEHAAITALIGWDSETPNGPQEERGLLGFFSEGSIDAKIHKLLRVEQQYGRKLELIVQERTHELSDALSMVSTASNEMILRLTRAVESKDEGTGWHIVRVGLYAGKIAEALGMPEAFIDDITFASAMHDIGKIGIPDRVLRKPGALSPEEEEIIKTHCAIGERILANSPYPKIQMSAVIALNHHERWDGSGYPNGLRGEEIPIEARILLICDCYDALRSGRHYKHAYDHEKAFRIITQGDSRTMPGHFDPRVLRAFIEHAAAIEEIFNNHS